MNANPIYTPTIDFELPKALECSLPTEERGLERDQVRLMVSSIKNDRIRHTQFRNITQYLNAGDVLVVNNSGTLKAALTTQHTDGSPLQVHFSTQQGPNQWVIELRSLDNNESNSRFFGAKAGQQLPLADNGYITLLEPYYKHKDSKHIQLWVAKWEGHTPFFEYMDQYGSAIHYNYIKKNYPLSYYQTIFAQEMGSAEMPSAGRAFTAPLVAQLVKKGVLILPITLHTGVASLELHEKPYDEYFEVPETTALHLNLARQQNRRIIAVGTTVIRALETATNKQQETHAMQGWTDIFITPQRGIFAVDGLLTGLHEPKASHLQMLAALAGSKHLQKTYVQAIEQQYLWHEFGDLHLILP